MILLTILLVVFVIISIVLILGISFLGWSFWLLFGDLVVFIGIIVSIIISIIKNKKDWGLRLFYFYNEQKKVGVYWKEGFNLMKNSGRVLSILGFVVSGIGALAGIAGGIISGKKQSIEINNAVAKEVSKQLSEKK